MLLSESYKIRLKELAGLTSLDEAMDPVSKSNAMKKSSERFTFDRNKMKEAIEQGREIGLSFQSNNSNYKMPVTKYRIVWPVAMGIDKKGNLVIRGYHVEGQSEKAARETGVRSAEATDVWRLFKVNNIKNMWFTDNFFNQPLPNYKERDSAMVSMMASYSPAKAKAYQDSIQNQVEPEPETDAEAATAEA